MIWADTAWVVRHAARLGRYGIRKITRPDVIRVNGNRFRLPASASPLMRDMIYWEQFGRTEIAAIRYTLRSGDVVVDVGAGIGFVGVHIARIVGAAHVHLVEANKDLVPYIAENFALNGLAAPDVHYGVACAGAREATAAFNVATHFWASSAQAIDDLLRRDVVPAVDINTLIRDHGATVVLLDIEGGEHDLIPRCDVTGLRAFIVELHRTMATDRQVLELFKFFVDRGFLVDTVIDGDTVVFRRAA